MVSTHFGLNPLIRRLPYHSRANEKKKNKRQVLTDKTFDLELEEKRIGRKYRKKIFKKIAHLTFLEKKHILRLADEEFINGLIALDQPRKNHFMNHCDRFYLSTRLHYIDDAMDQLKKVEKLQKVQKQKANIKLVWVNKS